MGVSRINCFYELDYFKNNIAVITPENGNITYGELRNLCCNISGKLDTNKKNLVIILCTNTYESLCGYLACLRSGNVPLLLDAKIDAQLLQNLVETYKPEYIWYPRYAEAKIQGENILSIGQYCLCKTGKGYGDYALNQDLALLLSTSGSTGSPKLVRLSRQNIQSNADSICQYLNITENERPITVLPMQYTYGLSIINSHLNKGAAILLTDTSIMQAQFWEFARANRVTSLSGVPYTYQMYKRLKLMEMDIPTLKTITQAGGKLPLELGKEFAEKCGKRNIKFYIMYGATEATARMAYLPYDRVVEKYASIGVAIPGGKFSIIDDAGNEVMTPETDGELVYEGENVMMGYAECGMDLAKGDELGKRLVTGDIAKFDNDGYFYIVGRKKRFIKLFGNRVNLDELEQILKSRGYDSACTGIDDKLYIFITKYGIEQEIISILTQTMHMNAAAFKVIYVEEIPRNEAGKPLYSKLNEVTGIA